MSDPVSNVLLITVDSLRADHGRLLETVSDDATSFTEAYSCAPSTPSSFPAILTGTQPLLYGGYEYLDDRRPFLARTLSEAGFRTVGFHSNPHLGANRNYDTGFDVFNDSAEGSDAVATVKDRVERVLDPDSRLYSILRRVWHRFSMATDSSAYAKAPTITDNARDWFDTRWDGEEPFFMWLHYMDVHYPFMPPAEFVDGTMPPSGRVAELNRVMQEAPDELTEADVEDLLELYRGEIRFTDHHIDRLLRTLGDHGILDETAVVVTADHGEAFGEHGRFGHHPYLYDELVHVPLYIRLPGTESSEVDTHVSLLDLPPTVCELLGVDPDAAMQGRSLLPAIRGDPLDDEVAMCTGAHGGTLACRTPDWKCFWRVDDGVVELYDLVDDPGETVDVSGDNPEIIADLRQRMESYLADAEASDVTLPEVDDSAEVQQRLRDLGYVD